MADEQNQPNAGSTSAATENTGNMIPKARFDEVLDRAKKAEEALARLTVEANAREQSRLQEEGRWKELAETRAQELAKLQPYQERAQTLEATIRAANEARIAQVPEVRRKVIPTELPPERLQQWLQDAWDVLIGRQAPDIDAGAGNGGGGRAMQPLNADEQEAARLAGMTPEQYAAQKAKIAAARNAKP